MSETRTTTTRTPITAGKQKPTTTTESKLSKTNEETLASAEIKAEAEAEAEANAETASTTLLGTSSKLLLKNQLHLNLNVISIENKIKNVDSQDTRSSNRSSSRRGICKLPSKADKVEATTAEVLRLKDDVINLETTTVTTVPKIQQKQQKRIIEASKTSISSSAAAAVAATATATTTATASPSSLLNSSPSALAKFNRIIDITMPATDCYQQQQLDKLSLQDREQQQQYHHQASGILTKIDSERNKKVDFPYGYDDDNADDVGLDIEQANVDVTNVAEKEDNDDEVVVPDAEHKIDEIDDNQMKRNDVHYLLKQLNSFSDIEEIEIVDMKQRRQQQAVTARALANATAAVITHSPTTTSLVIISPSSQSHKESRHVMRRFASLHQQHQYYSDEQSQYQTQDEHQRRHLHLHQSHNHHHHHHDRLQRHDQSQQSQQQRRHYTLNASGGNLRERLDPATEQQYLLQQFDDYLFESCHYLENNYFATTYRTAMIESSSHEFRPSTTTGTRSSPSAASSPHSYEIHEIELPSVICRAPPPPPSPTRRFNTQARLTSSGVQTELTASSLTSTSTTTTSHAAAQSITKSNSSSASNSGASACSSYTSSTEQRRRMPFFKCCYAPIGRWREKRNATAAGGGSSSSSGGSGDRARGAVGGISSQKTHSASVRHKTEAAAASTTHCSDSRPDSERQKQLQQQQQKKQHTTKGRKSGNAV